jgi:hypothetical protein
VLVKQIAGAILAMLIACAFGFGAAKPRAIGVGLAGRLFSLVSLFESLEVDHLHHPATRRRNDSLGRKTSLGGKTASRIAQANVMVIQNPRVMFSDSIKKYTSLCENRTIAAPTMRQRGGDR